MMLKKPNFLICYFLLAFIASVQHYLRKDSEHLLGSHEKKMSNVKKVVGGQVTSHYENVATLNKIDLRRIKKLSSDIYWQSYISYDFCLRDLQPPNLTYCIQRTCYNPRSLSAVSSNITIQYRMMLPWYLYIKEVNTELWFIFSPQELSAIVV